MTTWPPPTPRSRLPRQHYVTYLRVHARHQLDQVAAGWTPPPGTSARSSRRPAKRGSRAGQNNGPPVKPPWRPASQRGPFEARLFALKNRDAYKDHEKLALRRAS